MLYCPKCIGLVLTRKLLFMPKRISISFAHIAKVTTLLLASTSTVFAATTTSQSASTHVASTKTPTASPTAATANAPAAAQQSPVSSAFYLGLGADMVNRQGFTGLMPKASAGYGALFGGDAQAFYLGTEIFSGIWTIPLSPNQTYRITNIYGASLLPGYMTAAQNLFFIRLGVETAHYTKQSTATGAEYGVGLQAIATRNWDVRAEYDYGTNKNINQFSVDLIYHFYC